MRNICDKIDSREILATAVGRRPPLTVLVMSDSIDDANGVASGGPGSFLAGAAVFFVLKLTTSVDDIVWLSPFLALAGAENEGSAASPSKVQCALVYAAVCLLVTFEALAIDLAAGYGFATLFGALGYGGGGGMGGGDSYWNAVRVMYIIASLCIVMFAVREYREGSEEDDGESFDSSTDRRENFFGGNAEEAEGRYGTFSDSEEAPGIEGKLDSHRRDEYRRGKQQQKLTLAYLFAVAFFGTLDDLALFSAVLVGKSITYPSLLAGSMAAAGVVVAASWFVALSRPFAHAMEKVPLWALLLAVAAYMFIDSLLSD